MYLKILLWFKTLSNDNDFGNFLISYHLQLSISNGAEIAHTKKEPKEQKIRKFMLLSMTYIPLAKNSDK